VKYAAVYVLNRKQLKLWPRYLFLAGGSLDWRLIP
jgi:hypothetical protein